MFTKRVKSRIFFLSFFIILAIFVIFYTLKSLEDNVVYFLSPTEINSKSDISFTKKIPATKENEISMPKNKFTKI